MYNFRELEERWIGAWERDEVFRFRDDPTRQKLYVLDMFPYPSGSGLHVGHLKGYLATDIWARFHRMRGYCVFHPMGWDSFGLPAEQYAIQTGNSPAEFTRKNIDAFRSQLRRLCLSYDFSREVDTSDPRYFGHTQFIFSRMYEEGLAELRETLVNWCEGLNTVLSDEEIVEGPDGGRYSERGNFPITHRRMRQWVLRITDYADELLDDLNGLNWPDNIVRIQRNWIGRVRKYVIPLTYENQTYKLYLRNLNTLEHLRGVGVHEFSQFSQLLNITGPARKLPYQLRHGHTGKALDVYFIENVDFRSDDLLPMLYPGQEDRDPGGDDNLRDIPGTVHTYKLKDWVFSRQRYWGEPIPILFDGDGNISLEGNLPLLLPENFKYQDGVHVPLMSARDWVRVIRDGVEYSRECSTMPNWAGSSWYFLAFLLKRGDGNFHDLNSPEAREIIDRWMPVDVYVGGQEHAAMHLLYARFWYKFFHRMGWVNGREPFKTLHNQGMVLGEDGTKMSKSRGNAVNVNDIISLYGSDALRVYMAFSGPTELSFRWDSGGVKSMGKWLSRVHDFFTNLGRYVRDDGCPLISQLENNLIRNMASAILSWKVNLGVSEMMVCLNGLRDMGRYSISALGTFLKCLSFYAPALADELWINVLGRDTYLYHESWPTPAGDQSTPKEYRVFIRGKFKFIIPARDRNMDFGGEISRVSGMDISGLSLRVDHGKGIVILS